VTLASIWIFLF